jgi:Lrp/AsnC family leucine-responsive transcriptional regulator
MLRKTLKAKHAIDLVLDELDRKILYHWDQNARLSATKIAKLIGSNKETINFRMKRMIEDGIVTSFMTEVNTAKFGYNNIKVYLQFRNFNKGLEKEFFDYLSGLKEVGWVVSCSGSWDALFCFWATSTYAFHARFVEIMNRFGKHILNKQIIHNINWFYYNRKWLVPDFEAKAVKYGEEPVKMPMDDIDRKILDLLTKNGRESIVAIANSVDQSSQFVQSRIKKMEENGVITKYSLNIDYAKIGYVFCKTFIYTENATKERLEQFYNYCKNEPNVFALTTTSGQWDLELEFEVPDFETMTRIMDRIRIKFSDMITNYESVTITNQVTPMYVEG